MFISIFPPVWSGSDADVVRSLTVLHFSSLADPIVVTVPDDAIDDGVIDIFDLFDLLNVKPLDDDSGPFAVAVAVVDVFAVAVVGVFAVAVVGVFVVAVV